MAKKPIEDARSWSAKQPIRSVLNRTSRSDGPISRVHQEETRRAARPIRFVWQDNKADASSYKTEVSAQPIERLQIILRTNLQKEASAQPIKRLRSIFRTNLQTEASAQPIERLWSILRTDFLRTDHPSRRNRRLSQSHSLVGLSSDGLSLDGSSFRLNRRVIQSHPLVGLSSDGLSSDRSSFRLNRRLSQSQPSVGLSLVGLSSDKISLDGSSFGQKPSR